MISINSSYYYMISYIFSIILIILKIYNIKKYNIKYNIKKYHFQIIKCISHYIAKGHKQVYMYFFKSIFLRFLFTSPN